MIYKSLNEVESVIALGKPMGVVELFLGSYLQGLEYDKWAEGKDLEVDVYEPIDVSDAVAQWKADNKLEKKYGKLYGNYMVPFMNEDAIAMMQVKTGFEMGVTATNIEFSNGTVMPMTPSEFPEFAGWFVTHRNSYFV